MPVTHCIPAGSPWAAKQSAPPNVSSLTTAVVTPSGGFGHGNIRGRCIFIPSESAFATQFAETGGNTDFGTFGANIVADGWQTVAANEMTCYIPIGGTGIPSVASDVTDGSGGSNGARFAASTVHYLDHIYLWANQNAGGTIPTFLCGYSWGAWTCPWVAFAQPGKYIGFMSRCSPYDWSDTPAVPQLAGDNTTGMNFTATLFNTCTTPGHFSTSTNDGFTRPLAINTMANNAIAASAPITLTTDASDGHAWTSTETTDFTSWVTSVLDPLYPKTF